MSPEELALSVVSLLISNVISFLVRDYTSVSFQVRTPLVFHWLYAIQLELNWKSRGDPPQNLGE